MRGDSLRDRYAKGLALVGLGLLSGVGLMVEHWPVAPHLPHVAAIARLPRAAGPLAVGRVTAPNVTLRRTPSVRAVTPAPSPGAAPVAFGGFAVQAALRADPSPHALGAPVALGGFAIQAAIRTEPAPVAPDAPVAPVAPVAPDAPDAPVLPAPIAMDAIAFGVPVSAPVLPADSDGFFVGALKKTGGSIAKTGESIVRTSVKTGSMIGDALRGVGGAIIRVF